MIAQATSWQVPTIYEAAPHFGVALMFVLFVLGLPKMIDHAPPSWRESGAFRVFVFTLFLGGCAFAGQALVTGLGKLATG